MREGRAEYEPKLFARTVSGIGIYRQYGRKNGSLSGIF
jgi:hypothetical protein